MNSICNLHINTNKLQKHLIISYGVATSIQSTSYKLALKGGPLLMWRPGEK